MRTFYITYSVPRTNRIEVTRFAGKSEADARQWFSNQDWLDGHRIINIVRQS